MRSSFSHTWSKIAIAAIFIVVLGLPALAPAPVHAQDKPMSAWDTLANSSPLTPQSVKDIQYQAKDPFQLIGDIASGAILGTVQLVNIVLGFIAGILIWLGSQLITFSFQLNTYIMQMPVVLTGWKVTRDIANLGFTLALIVIAFMTILRVNQYSAQKFLPKLIAAAILVNFSLAIGGAVLDFTNVVTKFFIDRSIGNSSQSFQIGDSIAAAFNPQGLLSIDQQAAQKVQQSNAGTSGLSDDLTSVASTFFIAVFTFLMALTLLAIALMLLSRFVWLAFLMAIAPIPWLFNVIPIGELRSQGKKWWSKFMHWAFVAPILSFFLYLTMATVDAIKTFANTIVSQNSNANLNPTVIAQPVLQVTNMLILVGFLVGALLAANSMGIAGAGALVGFAKKTGQKAKGWVGRQTVGAAGEGIKRGWNSVLTAGSKGDEKGRTWLERAGESGLSKVPLLGAALTGMAGASRNAKVRMEKTVDDSYKNDKVHSKEALANKLNRQLITSQVDVGSALALAEKGGLNLLDDRKRSQLVDMIRKTGMQDKFAAYDPVIAALAGEKSFDESMKKYVGKVQDVSKLDNDTIRQSARYFRQGQITQLGNNGTNDQKEAFEQGIKEAFVPKTWTQGGQEIAEKGREEARKKYEEVEGQFAELDKAEGELDKNLKDYKDAKDAGDRDKMTQLLDERTKVNETIKTITGNLLSREGLSDADFKERQRAFNSRVAAKRQIGWQDFYGTSGELETESGVIGTAGRADDDDNMPPGEPLIKPANEYTDLKNVRKVK